MPFLAFTLDGYLLRPTLKDLPQELLWGQKLLSIISEHTGYHKCYYELYIHFIEYRFIHLINDFLRKICMLI